MFKRTAKYTAAIATLNKLPGKHPPVGIFDKQEDLYLFLQKKGFMWNSKLQIFQNVGKEPSDDPTAMIRVRVWAALDTVDDEAAAIVKAMKERYDLVERSAPYACRPPKQREGRVYLSFMEK